MPKIKKYQNCKNDVYQPDEKVISLAEVVETYKKSDFKENEKHSEVRWISREEVDTFKEDTVKDFKNTLKLAFAKMEEMYGNTDE